MSSRASWSIILLIWCEALSFIFVPGRQHMQSGPLTRNLVTFNFGLLVLSINRFIGKSGGQLFSYDIKVSRIATPWPEDSMRVPPGPKRVKNDVKNVKFMENFEHLRIDQNDHRWFQGASGRRSERQRLPKNTPAWEIRNVPKSPQTHHIWPRKWFKISNFLVLTHNIPTNVFEGILINYYGAKHSPPSSH